MRIVGVGTQIVECLRIAKMIERHGEQFINRVYTPGEIDYCNSRPLSTQHFAAYWAAKEAILKVLGVRWGKGINWRDIEIRHGKDGRSGVGFRGGIRDIVVSRGIREIVLSTSHCRSHAVGYAIGMGDDGGKED